MRIRAILLFIPLILAGCGPSTPDVVELRKITERDMKTAMDNRMKEAKISATCKDVSLVEQTPAGQYPQIYTGFADFTDGSRIKLKVTVGQDQNMIWETG